MTISKLPETDPLRKAARGFSYSQLAEACRLMRRADFKRSFPGMRESEVDRERQMLEAAADVLGDLEELR